MEYGLLMEKFFFPLLEKIFKSKLFISLEKSFFYSIIFGVHPIIKIGSISNDLYKLFIL